jgi:hypothetical protein
MDDFKNEHYKSMYAFWDKDKPNYNLNEGAFSDEIRQDIENKTGLELGSLGDWWVFPNNNPIMLWEDLIMLSLKILNTQATKIFVNNLFLDNPPEKINVQHYDKLPSDYVSGAKRINASAGDYTDYSGTTGIMGLLKQTQGIEEKPKDVKMSDKLFRLSGKDESCCVEGTWLDWVCFACNVLASENTKLVCPDFYELDLANANY